MNISEKIKEMQENFDKCPVLEDNKEKIHLEGMLMIIINGGGSIGPSKIIGESEEYLDLMLHNRYGPIFSISLKKEIIRGLSILHKPIEDELNERENKGMSKALYQ